jgi:Protein of unknown function (DUF3225)
MLRCACPLEKRQIVNYGCHCAGTATLFGCDSTQSEIGRQIVDGSALPKGWQIAAAHISVIDEPQAMIW